MTTYNVGDTVYTSHGRHGRIDVRKAIVTKVTPTGQITVDCGDVWPGNGKPRLYRFKHGREIGVSVWEGGSIITESDYARLSPIQARRDAMRRVARFSVSAFDGATTKAEALAQLAKLTKLVNAIPEDAA